MRTNFNSTHNKRITNIGHQTKCLIMKTLGDCLKSEREKKKLKVEDLAKKLNFSVKNILKVEEGVKRKHYMIIGVMLKFYKKKLMITLVDEWLLVASKIGHTKNPLTFASGFFLTL